MPSYLYSAYGVVLSVWCTNMSRQVRETAEQHAELGSGPSPSPDLMPSFLLLLHICKLIHMDVRAAYPIPLRSSNLALYCMNVLRGPWFNTQGLVS